MGFLRHWYVGGFFVISHHSLNILQLLDRRLALKVTFRHWLKPLYQDYTAMGYIFGLVFRTTRVFIASLIYAALILVAAAVYIIWAVAPVYIIYFGIINS
ncbi:MAG: hypothetical protein Q8O87_02525 [bacterium]|nr:hypothetical protein [bacterium]